MDKITKPSLFVAGSGKSMMRWSLYAIVILVLILALTGAAIQLILALRCSTVDWTGFSLYIGSLTTLAGVGITGKVIQKKFETPFGKVFNKGEDGGLSPNNPFSNDNA